MRDVLTIGSRGSALALWQSRAIAALLEGAHQGLRCPIEIIKTTGDVMRDASLVAIAGKGVFTKEIEDAMLEGRVDIAVHSLKDLPTTLPDGLTLGAITQREDPRDAFVGREGISSLDELPDSARIGTSSPRRRVQLQAWRADIDLVDLRGNVDTRLRKIEADGLDGIILACAGLRRLGLAERITEPINVATMVPAVGQGALGIEMRSGDPDLAALLAVLHDSATAACCRAERSFLAAMGGGCAQPIAGHARLADEGLEILGAVAEDAGVTRHRATANLSDPESLGRTLASMYGAKSDTRTS